MLSRLFRGLVAVFLGLALALPFAAGQDKLPSVERGVSGETPAAPSEKTGSPSPSALPYAVLLLYTLLVMSLVCMPSRKV